MKKRTNLGPCDLHKAENADGIAENINDKKGIMRNDTEFGIMWVLFRLLFKYKVCMFYVFLYE